MTRRSIVLVSGAPGAGKTTLAGPLARLLGLPLIAKDDIK
jgi:adenylate kinase family enzyme